MSTPLVIGPEDRPEPMRIGGFEITTILSGDQSGGLEMFLQAGPAGTGPGPHFHDWDESFYVMVGTLECGVDGTETTAGPGTFIHVPAGATHWYRFGPDGGEMLSVTSPGNASKMYAAFHEAGSSPDPERVRIVEIAASWGQTVVPAAE